MKKMKVRVIFFDLDGTLVWVPGNSQAEWIAKTLKDFGFSPATEALERAYHISEKRWQETVRPTKGFTSESFTEWNRIILEELEIKGNLTEIAKQIQKYWNNPADQLFTDVPETLETLRRQDIRLGIVTHRPSEGIDYFLKKHGLAPYFEWKANPNSKAPHGKLDKTLWEPLLKSAEVSPDQALHVGDDFETDVRGARRAGLHAVWIDRTELAGKLYPGRLTLTAPTEHAPAHEQPCARIGDLKQLTELVQAI
ncbi:HAD family hydrolase [Candidatus Acetothermia bacterium]|nr:HAD family hydrolase [Candidatus Acetothermia bacterium]